MRSAGTGQPARAPDFPNLTSTPFREILPRGRICLTVQSAFLFPRQRFFKATPVKDIQHQSWKH
jgi:hypothetical protein